MPPRASTRRTMRLDFLGGRFRRLGFVRFSGRRRTPARVPRPGVAWVASRPPRLAASPRRRRPKSLEHRGSGLDRACSRRSAAQRALLGAPVGRPGPSGVSSSAAQCRERERRRGLAKTRGQDVLSSGADAGRALRLKRRPRARGDAWGTRRRHRGSRDVTAPTRVALSGISKPSRRRRGCTEITHKPKN